MSRKALAVLCALLLGAAACRPGPGAPGIEGSVEAHGTPVPGAFVEAFDRAPDGVAAAVASANTDSRGRFSLSLPRGRYWVTARKKPQGGAGAGMFFGAPPGPVKVEAGTLSLPPIALADSSGEGGGGAGTPVTGIVTSEGRPRGGAFVFLYPVETGGGPAGGRTRGPGYAAKARSGADGSFRLLAPPGPYRLVGRMRGDGDSMGTLAAGDLVHEGGAISLGTEPLEVGEAPLHPVDSALLAKRRWAAGEGGLTLSGRVTDEMGRPVGGVHAFLYPDHRMVGKPAALSAPTGKDGVYRLAAPGPGAWYLGARTRFGGPVEPGELMGVYEVDGLRSPLAIGPAGPSGAPLSADIVVREVW